MPHETLGELRARLQRRLGFAATGAAAGVNATTMNDFLQEAQVMLYWASTWRLIRYVEVDLGTEQYLVDYPAEANPDRILCVSRLEGSTWIPLTQGLEPCTFDRPEPAEEGETVETGMPTNYETWDQIELRPVADQAYVLRVTYVMALGSFTLDADTTTIDSDLVFMVALANAKAHYRQPDADRYMTQASELLAKLKGGVWGQKTYNRKQFAAPLPRPLVEGRDI